MKKNRTASHLKQGERLPRTILIVVMLIVVVMSVYPFAYMLLVSFMNTTTMRLNWDLIKNGDYTLGNYARLFGEQSFLMYFKNSAIVTIYAVVVTCLTSAMAAYAFAKKKFPGQEKLFLLYLATMMINGQVTLIPCFVIIYKLGMLNTYSAMALPTVGAFGVLLTHGFLKTLPNDLLEAADLDGCSEFYKFTAIVLPLIKPVLVSLAIFTFISVWGSLILPLIVANKPNMTTLPVAIAAFRNFSNVNEYGLQMAANTVAFLPPFIMYLFLQKQFVEGIALSGTKL